jgi:hypothetical protein
VAGITVGPVDGLRRQDSNLNYLNQNQRCCHYTTADYRAGELALAARERSSHADAPRVELLEKFARGVSERTVTSSVATSTGVVEPRTYPSYPDDGDAAP